MSVPLASDSPNITSQAVLPQSWRMARLGHVAWLRARLGWKGLKADEYVPNGYPLLSTPDIKGKYIDFENVNFISKVRFDESPDIKLSLGDVLLAKDGSTLGTVNVVRELSREATVNSSIAVLTPGKKVNPLFLFYSLQGSFLVSLIQELKGGMGVPHLFQDDIKRFPLALPPLDEQRQIAEYLDRETGKIDELIAKQEQLVATLTERRQVLIAEAVTRGLDSKARLIDSGVEWIGEMPAHWSLQQLKRLSQVKRGASPRPIDDPKYFDEDGEWAWVRIADASSSNGRLTETSQTLSALGSSLSVRLEPGSLFVSIAGTVGMPCITLIRACIHDGFVYFPGLNFSKDLLFRIFEAGRCYAGLGKLGTQLNLNTDTIGSIQIPVPPTNEQDAIVEYLHHQTLRIDRLVSKSQLVAETLRERRAALISAAVTGKIDVRGL